MRAAGFLLVWRASFLLLIAGAAAAHAQSAPEIFGQMGALADEARARKALAELG